MTPLPMLDIDQALQAFVREDTGVPFAPLVRFATPLFEAYGIDADRALALRGTGGDDEAPEELLLVLETARLIWAYFALDGDAFKEALPQVEGALLQGDVTERERVSLHLLLARLEDTWHELEGEREPQGTAAPLPFDTLHERYQTLFPPDADDDVPGDDADALAAFAQPLLDAPGVREDLDAFEEQMDLAQALFELAQTPPSEHPALLAHIGQRFPDEVHRLPELARELTARYHALRSPRPQA